MNGTLDNAEARRLLAEYLLGYGNELETNRVVENVMARVLANPEGPLADTLKIIASWGDLRLGNIVEPLLDQLERGGGDSDWMEEIIVILGRTAHLAQHAIRLRTCRLLAEYSVSDEIINGSGVDYAACKAIGSINRHLRGVSQYRHPYLPLHECITVDRRCRSNQNLRCDMRGENSYCKYYQSPLPFAVPHTTAAREPLTINIGERTVEGQTVSELYSRAIRVLNDYHENGVDLHVPHGTSAKRFLIARSPTHPTGEAFTTPIEYNGYYMEANKSREAALKHLSKYLAVIGLHN